MKAHRRLKYRKRVAVRCSASIEGPKIDGRGNVAWRRQCRRRTTHESGRCYDHRPPERTGPNGYPL